MAGLWDVLVGAATGGNEQLNQMMEQQRKLQQLQFAAQSEAQAKAQYSPEIQAQSQALAQIQQLFPIPSAAQAPTLRLAPGVSSTPAGQDMLTKFQAAQQGYQGRQQEAGVNRLKMLKQFGLLPRAPLGLEDISAQAQARSAGMGAQSERSYEVNSRSIDQYQKPVDERLDRLSRLQDTINQQTPQADALVAPELLTVMAGGQGSGLRMNEAEIARIVGGRTNLEGLKAALNKLQLNPNKGLSITPAQRQQVRSLVGTVHQKLLRKSEILNEARQQLINTSTPDEHRNVIFQMRNHLQSVDTPSVPTLQSQSGEFQEGQTARNPKTGQTLTYRNGQWQ